MNDDDAHLVETQLASEVEFAGKLLEVRSDKVRLPNGGTGTREFVVHPGAALVVPVLDDGRLVLERQFRYPVRRVMLEFPAGKIDAGESAARDARSASSSEEAGYAAATWKQLGTIHPRDRLLDRVHRRCTRPPASRTSGSALDEGEFLDVVR